MRYLLPIIIIGFVAVFVLPQSATSGIGVDRSTAAVSVDMDHAHTDCLSCDAIGSAATLPCPHGGLCVTVDLPVPFKPSKAYSLMRTVGFAVERHRWIVDATIALEVPPPRSVSV